MSDYLSLMVGASNHSDCKRAEGDYYATDPKAVELLLENETFSQIIWEPCCGGGHISEVLKAHGHKVISSDIVNRGYADAFIWDFLMPLTPMRDADVITNPPYKNALDFVMRAVDYVRDGGKVAMLLRLTFLEGQKRGRFFAENPPQTVYVFRKRISCHAAGEIKDRNAAVAFAWFVWRKGHKGETVIKWIN